MRKMVAILFVLVCLLLCICGCSNIDKEKELTAYKLSKVSELTLYVDNLKGNSDYDIADCQLMSEILQDAIKQIANAKNIEDVDKIYNGAMLSLNCIDTMDNHKFAVVNKLTGFISEKVKNNFYNWQALEKITNTLQQAIQDITSSQSKTVIDEVYSKAVVEVNNIEPCNSNGRLLELKDAFEQGYITHNDLLDIAKIAHVEDKPEITEEKVLNAIKNCFCQMKKDEYPDKTAEDVHIKMYFGNYNGVYVIQIPDFDADYPTVSYDYIVDGVTITLSGPEPLVWILI